MNLYTKAKLSRKIRLEKHNLTTAIENLIVHVHCSRNNEKENYIIFFQGLSCYGNVNLALVRQAFGQIFLSCGVAS